MLMSASGLLLGITIVSAANIAGMVARTGLSPNGNPENDTALFLCYVCAITMAIAGGLFAVANR